VKEALELKIYGLERQLSASLSAQKNLDSTCSTQEKEMLEMEKTFGVLKQRYNAQKDISKKMEEKSKQQSKEYQEKYDKLVDHAKEKISIAEKELETQQNTFSKKEMAYLLKISQLALRNERLERELEIKTGQIQEMERIYSDYLPSMTTTYNGENIQV